MLELIGSENGKVVLRGNNTVLLADWELAFVDRPGKARTPVMEGAEVAVARRMLDKYKQLLFIH